MPSPTNEYSWDFSAGPGAWASWFAPSVVQDPGGAIPAFTRFHAPGTTDVNHVDGIGSLFLLAHLSIPTIGSAGVLNLADAEFEITIKGTDFEANGGKLMVWVCRYIPEEGVLRNYYVGLQVTNWANTGNDLAAGITDEWRTLTVQLSDDPADWTYAGNAVSIQGDWADRYQPLDLASSLDMVNATLHLVMVADESDQGPSGFLDIANITVRTQTPATPVGVQTLGYQLFHGLEDQDAVGLLAGDAGVDPDLATYQLVAGSATNGSVVIDPVTGAFTFTPNTDFYGPTDFVGAATFRYTVTDGSQTSAVKTVVVFVGPINDAPVTSTADVTMEVTHDQPFAYTIFGATDVDRELLTYRLVDGSVQHGTVTLDPDNGRYVFTPEAGYVGAASFQYVVSDGQLDSPPATITLNVHAAGDDPVLPTFQQVIDTYLLAGDAQGFYRYVVLLADAGDVNAAYHYGTWLHTGAIYRIAILDDLGYGAPQDHARAVEGYLQAARMGDADAMYTLGRRYLSAEGVAFSAADAYFWLGVALKYDGGPLFPAGVNQFDNLLIFNQQQAVTQAGLTPTQVAALDALIAAWSVGQPSPVNDAPVAGTDSGEAGPAGAPISGTLAPGSDVDGDRLTYVLTPGSAEHGVVVIDPRTGAWTFTPDPDHYGPASFRYVVSDGQAHSAEQTVSLNFAPVTNAVDDVAGLDEAASLTIDAAQGLLTNDAVSAVGTTLSITAVAGQGANVGQAVAGTYGSITITADGGYTYVANASTASLLQGQTYVETFTYTVTDADGVSDTATLHLTLHGVSGTIISGDGTLQGSAFDDVITGGAGHDVLLGLAGNDRLVGGVGALNELFGGTGDDTYVVSDNGDTIVETVNEGLDTVETGLSSFNQRNNVENLTYTGSGNFIGSGNALSNVIRGGVGSDTLIGNGGNDTLIGGSGAANTLLGGAGDDIYVVSNAGDSYIENADEGTDLVLTDVSALTLRVNVENLTYSGSGQFSGTGNAS
ncbi:MAG: tandem-95 repeat protein, partial [Brevundimonas sp.]